MNQSQKQNLIIFFGGSFDPPHLGHEAMIDYVLQSMHIDQLMMVPTWNHPLEKKTIASFEHRLKMCELITKKRPQVKVSDIEKKIQGSGRTIETLHALKKEYPRDSFRILLGSDQIAVIDQWHRFEEIKKIAPPIFLSRPNFVFDEGSDAEMPNISSTEVRARIQKHQSISDCVSPEIAGYIQQHKLYQKEVVTK